MYSTKEFTRPAGLKKATLALLCLLGLAVTIGLSSAAPSQPKIPPCTELSGTFVFTVFAFDSSSTAHAEGEIWIDGDLAGHFHASYFNIEQMGQGVLQMNGIHVHTYLDGSTLITHDEIRLQLENNAPGIASANSRLYIAGGSGKFANATGLLHTHGELNLVTLEGGIDFKGQVCVP
jgi:hypothetical protein